MPSLFRRKSAEVVTDAPGSPAAPSTVADDLRPRGYTPSKRELGRTTPKRRETGRRSVEPPPTNRREALKRMRDKQRVERGESRRGMLAGEERYLLPRDRGPERGLARDIVDSRRTIGTWFFGLTFLVMIIGFNRSLAPVIYLAANLLFALFGLATVIDSVLIARQVRRLVTERFPATEQRLRGLYFYAIMRGISFRFIRNPKPKVKVGQPI